MSINPAFGFVLLFSRPENVRLSIREIFRQGATKAMLGVLSAGSLLRSICDAEDKTPSMLPDDFSTRFFDVQNAKTEPIWQGTKAAGIFIFP